MVPFVDPAQFIAECVTERTFIVWLQRVGTAKHKLSGPGWVGAYLDSIHVGGEVYRDPYGNDDLSWVVDCEDFWDVTRERDGSIWLEYVRYKPEFSKTFYTCPEWLKRVYLTKGATIDPRQVLARFEAYLAAR